MPFRQNLLWHALSCLFASLKSPQDGLFGPQKPCSTGVFIVTCLVLASLHLAHELEGKWAGVSDHVMSREQGERVVSYLHWVWLAHSRCATRSNNPQTEMSSARPRPRFVPDIQQIFPEPIPWSGSGAGQVLQGKKRVTSTLKPWAWTWAAPNGASSCSPSLVRGTSHRCMASWRWCDVELSVSSAQVWERSGESSLGQCRQMEQWPHCRLDCTTAFRIQMMLFSLSLEGEPHHFPRQPPVLCTPCLFICVPTSPFHAAPHWQRPCMALEHLSTKRKLFRPLSPGSKYLLLAHRLEKQGGFWLTVRWERKWTVLPEGDWLDAQRSGGPWRQLVPTWLLS